MGHLGFTYLKRENNPIRRPWSRTNVNDDISLPKEGFPNVYSQANVHESITIQQDAPNYSTFQLHCPDYPGHMLTTQAIQISRPIAKSTQPVQADLPPSSPLRALPKKNRVSVLSLTPQWEPTLGWAGVCWSPLSYQKSSVLHTKLPWGFLRLVALFSD